MKYTNCSLKQLLEYHKRVRRELQIRFYNNQSYSNQIIESYQIVRSINQKLIENCYSFSTKFWLMKLERIFNCFFDENEIRNKSFINQPFLQNEEDIVCILETIIAKLGSTHFYSYYPPENKILSFYYGFIVSSFFYVSNEEFITFFETDENIPTPHHLFLFLLSYYDITFSINDYLI